MSDQQCSRLSWADPVGQAQQVFRLALTALSRPAQAHVFVPCPADTAADELPAGLSPELAALALSLCDNETTPPAVLELLFANQHEHGCRAVNQLLSLIIDLFPKIRFTDDFPISGSN